VASYSGWYARRRGILQHLDEGQISLLDLAVHDFLCLTANHQTGVAWVSALKIKALCPADISLRAIQRSLAHQEEISWIKRFRTHGQRGNYPVVIGKYFVTDASLKWKSVNLERTTDWREVQFDPVTDPSFVGEAMCHPPVTEVDADVSPVQEVRSKKGERRKTATTDCHHPAKSVFLKRLKDKIKRESSGETAKEFLNALKAENPNAFEELIESVKATGFKFALNDGIVGADLLIAIGDVFRDQKVSLDSGDLTRGTFCTKIIDACMKAKPKIPYPPAFQDHRDALRKEERAASAAA